MGIAFTAAAALAALIQVSAWVGVPVLVVGTVTCAVWFVGVTVRTLAGKGV